MPSDTVLSGSSPGSAGRFTRRYWLAPILAPSVVTVSVFHCSKAARTSSLR